MKTNVRNRIKQVLIGVFGLLAIAVISIYAISSYRLNRKHEVASLPRLTISTEPEEIARGGHIATTFGMCTACHGGDLGGKIFLDRGSLGTITAPNLTRGRGGVGRILTDDGWVRAIRHGIRHDGTSLMFMPSDLFVHFTEVDLLALVSYLKQAPRVDRDLPSSELYFQGRTLLALGKLNILTAEKIPDVPLKRAISQVPSVAYGHYLSFTCRSCHKANLSGGAVQAPGIPPAANLTSVGIGAWRETDFVRTLRTGKRPNGKVLNSMMPWPQAGMMTDDELHAIWLYLRSVPPLPFGTKPSAG